MLLPQDLEVIKSTNMPFLMILFCAVIVIFYLFKLSLRPPHFPPGPRGLPLLGYSPLMPTKDPFFKTMQKLAKTYGPVTGFYLGPTQPFISVVGAQAVREALQNGDLSGRPSGAILLSRTFGERLGLSFVEGDFWQEQRRFTLRHLRDLGFGKTSIEDQMMGEITDLISEITATAKSNRDHVVDFKSIFSVSVINILWAIIGGKRFQRDDPKFKKLLDNIDQFLQSGNVLQANLPVPAILVRLFPSLPGWLGINTQLFVPIQKFIEETIDEHISTRSNGDAARDYIDVYLDEMERQLKTNESTTFSKKQLISIIQDLFGAGFHTSSSSIGFAVLYMIHYPTIQQQMRDELDDICGDSLPSLAHRSRLPYTEAVLMEVMRIATIAPAGVPHCAMKETQLQGFTIPKGSILAINLDSASNDATAWKDPENFRPERHLDENGKVIKNENLIPFGLGRRVCLGEPLARNTIFLFVACLVKTFAFKSVPNEPLPTLEPNAAILLSPKPFFATAIPRVYSCFV
ncbi:methyl farnesoate epoxidase-like isoform X1 [Daphnia pulex]|uniref:methyl farnesoate epoxidase-like isoform X1 n=2 Tax=Daphnia pulex TaxID=6669 RepID=UPI001EE0F655|nr:methyl farnesoate epoxidase-like isoform X1 [Daphnia pulex]XP_046454334.1 methyl farnesoate epoxidase-like isoform X1 [Daphnia pulex]XP_046454335.1 methyl farnesoate epoxidase-like isoform X1 [Daphnia pulex]